MTSRWNDVAWLLDVNGGYVDNKFLSEMQLAIENPRWGLIYFIINLTN